MAKKPARTPSIEEASIGHLMRPILEVERRRLNKTLIDLNRRNKLLTKSQSDGFLFGGVFEYPVDFGGALPTLAQRTALHDSLWAEMEELKRDRAGTKDDLKFIQMLLARLLRGCESVQDVRNAIPEFLVQFYPPGKGLSRTREELWTLKDDARALSQYRLLESKLAVYVASRLIY